MRKALLLTALFLSFTINGMGQITIPNTHVQFSFPNGGWKYLNTTEVDNNTTIYLYTYAARNVVDEFGDTVLPNLRIYVKQQYNNDVYQLSFDRFNQLPFQTLDEFKTTQIKNSLGIIGAYRNPMDDKDYEFRAVYLKEGTTAIEFRTETTVDTFDAFDKEFQQIIATLKTNTR